MDYVFDKASNLKKVNFTNFDAGNATTMEYMFRNCSSLT
jgi:surface protein